MSETTSDQKQRRILVVANETCGTSALCAEIGRRAADDDAQVLMISPALTRTRLEYWTSDVDRANAEVSQRLDRSISSLGELGVRARGEVGDPDPLQAIADALGTSVQTRFSSTRTRPSARTGSSATSYPRRASASGSTSKRS